jgi:hypothetical protein
LPFPSPLGGDDDDVARHGSRLVLGAAVAAIAGVAAGPAALV